MTNMTGSVQRNISIILGKHARLSLAEWIFGPYHDASVSACTGFKHHV